MSVNEQVTESKSRAIAILIVLLSICALILVNAFNGNSPGKIDTSSIDSARAKIETTYVRTLDTIYKIEMIKTKVDDTYDANKTIIDSSRADTTKLKRMFDSVYSISPIDSFTKVGYSQIHGALVVNSKFIRDSTKLMYSEDQLELCQGGLTLMRNQSVELADSAKKLANNMYTNGYSDGRKHVLKYSVVTGVVGVLIGTSLGMYLTH